MALNVCILSLNTGMRLTEMMATRLMATRIKPRKRRMEIIPATIMTQRRITPVTVINFNEAFESLGRFFILGR